MNNNYITGNYPEFIKQVAEFHTTFNHPILSEAQIPIKERSELRIKLIQEELDELKIAINNGDLVEAVDALCDTMYVLSGAILEFGLGEKFLDVFNEVHRSNMSKSCGTMSEVYETIDKYKKEGIESDYQAIGDRFIVYRRSDNKVLKNINYSSAEILITLNKKSK